MTDVSIEDRDERGWDIEELPTERLDDKDRDAEDVSIDEIDENG